ncbi:hypothetical protein RND81_08G061700 [Saponaria officinalis]|uniref:RanBP2-type domain-containing protein n=1 Tax=Saponaria officinalis TaxID=3572 RepID=A0AAW1J440_SAPOF
MSWAGDWMCGACQHMNFKKRDSCHRCGFSRYAGHVNNVSNAAAVRPNRTEVVLAGDWYCQALNCGAHNYASRVSCFRCSALKPECSGGFFGGGSVMAATGGVTVVPGWKTGDWICSRPGCGEHNYACRTGCYKCKTPRDFGDMF